MKHMFSSPDRVTIENMALCFQKSMCSVPILCCLLAYYVSLVIVVGLFARRQSYNSSFGYCVEYYGFLYDGMFNFHVLASCQVLTCHDKNYRFFHVKLLFLDIRRFQGLPLLLQGKHRDATVK